LGGFRTGSSRKDGIGLNTQKNRRKRPIEGGMVWEKKKPEGPVTNYFHKWKRGSRST